MVGVRRLVLYTVMPECGTVLVVAFPDADGVGVVDGVVKGPLSMSAGRSEGGLGTHVAVGVAVMSTEATPSSRSLHDASRFHTTCCKPA